MTYQVYFEKVIKDVIATFNTAEQLTEFLQQNHDRIPTNFSEWTDTPSATAFSLEEEVYKTEDQYHSYSIKVAHLNQQPEE